MNEIIQVGRSEVMVSSSDGKAFTVPISSVRYDNPEVGDRVSVYQDGSETLVTLDLAPTGHDGYVGYEYHRVNKYAYILIAGFFGALGGHRFLRRQFGLAFAMLLVGTWVTGGLWPLIDFIISLMKFTKYRGSNYIFDRAGRWVKSVQ